MGKQASDAVARLVHAGRPEPPDQSQLAAEALKLLGVTGAEGVVGGHQDQVFHALVDAWKAAAKENPDQPSPPSMASIADTLGLTRHVVQRVIDDLVARGRVLRIAKGKRGFFVPVVNES